MICRQNRFHGQASVRRTLSQGQTIRSGMVSLKYVRNPRRQSYRLAVVVSRKVSKSAVVRNRIRRRIYEDVRILSSTFTDPCDLVVLVYDARLAEIAASDLKLEIHRLCKKAHLLGSSGPAHAIVEA